MFRNLDAEQARFSYTNQQMADKLGISRVSYENKKKTGKFTALEAKKMCIIFKVKFDYLFATDDEMPKAHLWHPIFVTVKIFQFSLQTGK